MKDDFLSLFLKNIHVSFGYSIINMNTSQRGINEQSVLYLQYILLMLPAVFAVIVLLGSDFACSVLSFYHQNLF